MELSLSTSDQPYAPSESDDNAYEGPFPHSEHVDRTDDLPNALPEDDDRSMDINIKVFALMNSSSYAISFPSIGADEPGKLACSSPEGVCHSNYI